MSTYVYSLSCSLGADPLRFEGVSNELQVSLPCMHCKRDYRTVIFESLGQKGICTPRAKCDGFPGTLVERKMNRLLDKVEIHYEIEFTYEPFKDEQLGKEPVLGKYGWARIYFSVKCAACGEEELISTQENMVRPHTHKCACGQALFTESESPFKYSVKEKE